MNARVPQGEEGQGCNMDVPGSSTDTPFSDAQGSAGLPTGSDEHGQGLDQGEVGSPAQRDQRV